ncbi:MAG: putative regulatory protein [Mycobacterium sp.]|nr:putative regulatory protein [Mycobacterium sp.]
MLPGVYAREDDAVRWLSGQVPLPEQTDEPRVRLEHISTGPRNEGVHLVVGMNLLHQALETRISLVHHLHTLQADDADVTDAHYVLDMNDELIQNLRQQIRDARETLWGRNPTFGEVETQDDE